MSRLQSSSQEVPTGSCAICFGSLRGSTISAAFRSTKAAGKLKVLPDEPEHSVSKTTRAQEPVDDSDTAVVNGRLNDAVGRASDEEEEESEDLQDQEDIEVQPSCQERSLELIGNLVRSIIKLLKYPKALLGKMPSDSRRKRQSHCRA